LEDIKTDFRVVGYEDGIGWGSFPMICFDICEDEPLGSAMNVG
jgi:hypothetical protein